MGAGWKRTRGQEQGVWFGMPLLTERFYDLVHASWDIHQQQQINQENYRTVRGSLLETDSMLGLLSLKQTHEVMDEPAGLSAGLASGAGAETAVAGG